MKGVKGFQIGNTVGVKHGHTSKSNGASAEYQCWQGIKARCLNPNAPYYSYYGGRGVAIAPEWVNDFPAFLEHVGTKPTPRHTIDRIDNSGNYEPGNVRWATRKEQVDNRRSTRFLMVAGVQMTIDKASIALGVSRKLITSRLERGWSDDRIVRTPKLSRHEAGKLSADSRNSAHN